MMKKYLYKSGFLAFAAVAALTSCEPEIDVPEVSKGDANFERYVSLGNSLTAGFADGALYRSGQEASYPNILAQQFKLAGGGEFKQPLLAEGLDVGSPRIVQSTGSIELSQHYTLGFSTDCKGVKNLGPVSAAPKSYSFADLFAKAAPTVAGPYNNFGVPGALSYHLIAPGYGNPTGLFSNPATANPFYVRFASSTTTSVVQDAMGRNPTFFTLWIGLNDVLGYALAGGGNNSPTPPTGGTPTNPSFDIAINALVTTLTSGGAKGAIGNIPDISLSPYFNTVPYNGLVLDTTQATALTQAYAPFGIRFRVGPNPFIIKDNVTGGRRQLKPTEKVLLTINQDSLKCKGLGSQIPISGKDILTDPEINTIRTTVNSYNVVIKNAAEAKNLAIVDAFSVLNTLKTGVNENQVTYNTAFVTGNVFSLDGLHFAPRGNAIVANEFIKAINKKYNATIPTVNVNDYNAVLFP